MAKILDMPKLSPTMEEGVLSSWHKKEGDPVGVDDLLAEVETDKATMEFRAFDKGTLLKILVPAGAQVKLGQPVAIVGNAGEDVSSLAAQAGAAAVSAPQEKQAPAAGASQTTASVEPKVEPTKPETLPPPAQRKPAAPSPLDRTAYAAEPRGGNGSARPAEGGRVLASPYVRKVARERGIDLQGAQGSGPGGRVVPADLASLEKPDGTSPAPPERGRDQREAAPLAKVNNGTVAPVTLRAAQLEEPEVRPLSPMRKTIARRLTESKQTVPHFYLSIDVDASGLVKLREQINAELASGAPTRRAWSPSRAS
jgi:pyruvate dehydrogenase E2 component (dihydrolipoamide acetyltransferase)